MSHNRWRWNCEEGAEWTQELSQGEFAWIEELIKHIDDGLAGFSYDPLQPEDDLTDEDAVPDQAIPIR